jgi:sec-independent protein translocase protein TatA
MPNIGPMELAIVAVIALLVLGPKRLPSAGRSLGRGIREFRDGISGRANAELDAGEEPSGVRKDDRVATEVN